jgi:hypothetical protein
LLGQDCPNIEAQNVVNKLSSSTLSVVMVHLFDLPVDLVVPILRDWIDIFSLGKLDSASCSHSERVQYSKITRSKLFVCEDVHSEDFNDETNILHMK